MTRTSFLVFWMAAAPAFAEEELSSQRAAELAVANSPAVQTAKARLDAARRTLGWVGLSPHRTEIEVEGGPRVGIDGAVDGAARMSVSRGIELDGKAERRQDVATAEIRHAEAELEEAETRARIEALVLWADWVGAAERARVLRDTLTLADKLVEAVQRRVTSGAATRFDVNAARLARARALVEAGSADSDTQAVGAELGLLLGREAMGAPPRAAPVPDLPALATVVEQATARRGLVHSALAAIDSARARVALAQSEGTGDVALGGFVGYEERDFFAGLLLRWDLPSGNRADKETDVREAEVTAAESEAVAAKLELTRQITRAWHIERARRERADQLVREVDPLFVETTELLASAIARGSATAVELLAMLRERRELALSRVEAENEARTAAILVLAAMGNH